MSPQAAHAVLSGPLHVKNVGVSYGSTRILNMVELTLHPGEMCALIGPSGAGKSTLIKTLLGLREPDDGSVTVGSQSAEALNTIGYVPQDDALHRGLTVRRELGYAAELRMPDTGEADRDARITEVLHQVGLSDRADVRIRNLSGGQRKRVSVALELLTSPPMLILDEPTSGLDPGLEARTMELLAAVADTGRIVLVATHAMESLERADALCVLVRGHVAFFGPPQEALTFFRVERYADLFRQLEKQEPSAWHLSATADGRQQRFLRRPGPVRGAPAQGTPAQRTPAQGTPGTSGAAVAGADRRPWETPSQASGGDVADQLAEADRALDRLEAQLREDDE